MAAVKLKSRNSLTVLPQDISFSNLTVVKADLLKALMRGKAVEVPMAYMPTKENDVFLRRMFLARSVKPKNFNLDVPDIDDLPYTDLPWMGYCTFKDSFKAFRAKFYLSSVVELIREIDGFLYRLTSNIPGHTEKTVLLSIIDVAPADNNTKVRKLPVRKIMTDDDFAIYFSSAKEVPETLIKDMKALGFQLEGKVFTHPQFPGNEARIQCDLWGKINHINQHLREV